MRRAFAAVLAVFAATMPVVARAAAPPAAPAVIERYLSALQARRYGDAFALLDAGARTYYRTAENFASGFSADGATLAWHRVVGSRADASGRVVFVRERIDLDDPAHDVHVTTVVTIPYLVTGSGGAATIAESGRPWRAFAATASAEADGLRVSVKKLAAYARTIRVVVTMQNDGAGFVTVLPYGRSVLRDDAGGVYHPLATRDWTITDRQLFLGVRLAPNSRYTGAIAFATPALDDRARRFDLTLGPAVRDGGTAPVSVDVPGIAPRT